MTDASAPTPLTKSDREDIRARAQAATPGPWEKADAGTREKGRYRKAEVFVRRPGDDVAIASDILDPDTSKFSDANGTFIAAARTDIPALIATIDTLTAALAATEHNRAVAVDDVLYLAERIPVLEAAIATAEKERDDWQHRAEVRVGRIDALAFDEEVAALLRHDANSWRERAGQLEAALHDLLTGAEQQSQSHVDVAVVCRAALAGPDTTEPEVQGE